MAAWRFHHLKQAEYAVAPAPNATALSFPAIENPAKCPKEAEKGFSQGSFSSIFRDGNPSCGLAGDSEETEGYGGGGLKSGGGEDGTFPAL